MTPEEFVIWLRGFIAASSHYNLTPAGWEELKEQLKKVNGQKFNLRSNCILDNNVGVCDALAL